jgi:uncharacterized protein
MNIKINICLLLVLVTSLTFSQSNTEVKYDSVKAQKYGADEYGMKKYVMAFLKRGPNKDIDSTKRAELMNAHLTNIFRLADEGKLVLAGPFLNDGELRGIYIFDVENLDEAKKLTETDPAIQQGTLSMELIPWYGTAALIEVNELSKTLVKKSILGN